MSYRRASHVAWRRIGDETVLIHLNDKRIYVLNSSGGFFWHGLGGQKDLSATLENLPLDECSSDDASQSIETFLSELAKAGLVDAEGNENTAAPEISEDYPHAAFVPPELVWQEDIRNFGSSCAFMAGQTEACNAAAMG